MAASLTAINSINFAVNGLPNILSIKNLLKIKFICFWKQFFILLFLSLFIFNSLGYYLVFFAFQHQYRTARFERLKTKNHGEEPEILKFSLRSGKQMSYFWVKEGEIMFDGRLYDVVDEETTADSIIFHAYEDHKEQKMLAGFSDHIDTHSTDFSVQNKLPKKPAKPDVLKKILKDYIPNHSKKQFFINETSAFISFGEKPEFYNSAIISLPEIPPEVFKV